MMATIVDPRFAGASRRLPLVAAVMFLLTAVPAAAQLPPVPPELDPLAALEGEWEGSGWMEYAPGQRSEFSGTERVERRMGGRLVIVEGSFTSWMGPERGDVPVHQALGVFSYDAGAARFGFRTYTAHGTGGEASHVEVGDGAVVWGYDDPRFGTVRYTITITAQDEWHEVGRASSDGGATWHQFFEMTLRRL